MLQYFTIIATIICGFSSIKHHPSNALSFIIQTSLQVFIRMTEVYPGSQVSFLALYLKYAKFKEIVLKLETNSLFMFVTSNIHTSIAHILAIDNYWLHYLTNLFQFNSKTEP